MRSGSFKLLRSWHGTSSLCWTTFVARSLRIHVCARITLAVSRSTLVSGLFSRNVMLYAAGSRFLASNYDEVNQTPMRRTSLEGSPSQSTPERLVSASVSVLSRFTTW